MKSEVVDEELQRAITASEEMRVKGFMPAPVEAEIAELELSYESNHSADTRAQLLAGYVLLSRWLPTQDSAAAIKVRERFQQVFPDHFKAFMETLKASASSVRWSGCLGCKHYLGQQCAKGLEPGRLPSRYLKRDFACSAFEEKTG